MGRSIATTWDEVVLTGLSSKQLRNLVNLGQLHQVAGQARTKRQLTRQRRLLPTEQAAILSAYRAGQTMAALAGEYRVRRSTISQLLYRSSVQPREQRIMDQLAVRAAVQLYGQGLSLARIGDQLSFDTETIRRRLKQHGVLMRLPGRPHRT